MQRSFFRMDQLIIRFIFFSFSTARIRTSGYGWWDLIHHTTTHVDVSSKQNLLNISSLQGFFFFFIFKGSNPNFWLRMMGSHSSHDNTCWCDFKTKFVELYLGKIPNTLYISNFSRTKLQIIPSDIKSNCFSSMLKTPQRKWKELRNLHHVFFIKKTINQFLKLLIPHVLDLVPTLLARISHNLHSLFEKDLQLLCSILDHLLVKTPHISLKIRNHKPKH